MKVIVLLFASCLSFSISSQTFNQEFYPEGGSKFLLGPIKIDRLKDGHYGQWYNKQYATYPVDSSLLPEIKNTIDIYQVRLFLGTWCGDSKREVPRMLKIMEAAGYPMERLEIFAVDMRKEFYKTTPGGEATAANIVRVPTLIFLKNGVEVNRIIEKPVESLERDIAQILLEKPYTPNYAGKKR